MLDIKILRSEPDIIRNDLKRRRDEVKLGVLERAIKKDKEWLALKKEVDALRNRRNVISHEISEAKKKGKDSAGLIRDSRELPKQIAEKEQKLDGLEREVHTLVRELPNLLDRSVPSGEGEEQNVVVKKFGKMPKFNFEPKSHVDVLQELGMADIERAAKISGARFWFLKGEGVMMDLALQKYAVDFMRRKGYEPVVPPYMMRREPYEGVTSMADFEEMLYKVEDEDMHLIATSEHPLTAMYMGEIIEERELPIKMVGISTNFRKEAGSHGKDTKGIFRGHQFNKVEQVVICRREDSGKIHEDMIKNAAEFFLSLGLHFRQIMQCTGDIGVVAAKKYDLEVWMPVSKMYKEVVSCSNCTEYQARGLNIRYRSARGVEHVHTLNSTVVATSRAMVAIIENYQTPSGSVKVPEVLVPYMGGLKELKKEIKKN